MSHAAQSAPAVETRLSELAVGLYGWLYAGYFGLVCLDIVYAGTLQAEIDLSLSERIFRDISDFLLLLFALLVIAGGIALTVAARRPGPRNLLLVSWLLPVAAVPVVLVMGSTLNESGLGPSVRLLLMGVGSMLAMLGVMRFCRAGSAPD